MRAETPAKRTNESQAKRRGWTPSRRAVLLGLIPAAAIAAACGSSTTSSTSNTTKATTSGSASGAPGVMTANNAKFGTILVDGQGRTLYTFTNNGAAVPCTGACLGVWPAALLPSGQTTANASPGVSNVSTMSSSGGVQLTYKGLPLWRFSGDTSAGAANGDGINSFGGIWHVVKVSGGSSGAGTPGGTATTGGSGSGTTTTTSGGGGGGYSGGGY